MPHHHDMLYLQHVDRIFEGGADAVQAVIRLIGRHEIGNVTDDEQLARRGIENVRRLGPAVSAGNQHDARILAFAELPIQCSLF